MNMETKEIYLAPIIEVVEMEIETAIMRSSFGVSDSTVGKDDIIRSKRRGSDFWEE